MKMFLGYCKILAGVALLSFATNNQSWISVDSATNNGFLRESKLIMKSLDRALLYFIKRPESLTGDVVLGVLIANANLRWIYKRLKHYFRNDAWTEKQLVWLLGLSHAVIETHKYRNSAILNESLWEDAAENLKSGHLSHHDEEFHLPEFDSCQSIDEYMMKGTPNNSDFCINELLTSNCRVSDFCWLSEVNGDFHSGYKTSHRLLYFQIAFELKCDKANPRKFSGISIIKKKLCQRMFLEAVALFDRPTISVTRDLFMEQIALCGLEGYQEFAPEIWRHQLRVWQNDHGCFGLGFNFKNCSMGVKGIKRTDFVLDDCHTHVTSVAVSALAFFVRVTLKMAFNFP